MPTSFRDPDGRLLVCPDRVLRFVSEKGESTLQEFLKTSTAVKYTGTGNLVNTHKITLESIESDLKDIYSEGGGELKSYPSVFEHEKISFASYPYEWSPEMLYSAGELTLDLAEAALNENFGLKDATPYNIMFRGTDPIFLDLLSFERRDPLDPIWKPYAQFERTFLLPLLVNKSFGLQLIQTLTTSRDGMEPEEVYEMSSIGKKLCPPLLTLITLPVWMRKIYGTNTSQIYIERRMKNEESTSYILRSILQRLRRSFTKVKPAPDRTSLWSHYTNDDHVNALYTEEKQKFVSDALKDFSPQNVLDIGCNTGYFSTLAANQGAQVTAIDQDAVTIDNLWRKAKDSQLNILPLVIDLSRPSPALGWRNEEQTSFLSRAKGAFDMVFMLAVVHHMLVSERIPLSEVINLAADLTNNMLIIEFVETTDPMFKALARGRDDLYKDLTRERFVEACSARFHIVRSHKNAGRASSLFLLKRK